MWAAGGLSRQIPADATASQFGKAGATTLPLLPGDGAQPPPDPLIECAQHRRGLAEAEISAPADKVSGQLLGDLFEASSARASCQLPDSRFEASERLRRNAPSRLLPAGEAEAQELADARLGDRALGLVDLELEALFEEPFDPGHHPLARLLTAHIDVAVIGVAHEAVAALLQLLVQHIQHQVRQQRRERAALRRAFLRRTDKPSFQHARGQKAADQLQEALVSNPLGNQPHQDVVVDPVERTSPDRCPRQSRGRTRCTPAPVPQPDVPSASAGSRSSSRRTFRPSPLAALASPPAGSGGRAPSECRAAAGRPTTASINGPATAGRSRLAFAARASVAWAAAFGASPLAPVPKFSSICFFCRMARTRSPFY
ncbi:hypothetical protein ACVWXO_006436 [Bradyrhizobium sp. LM2.7]